MKSPSRPLLGLAALACATLIWLPLFHYVFRPPLSEVYSTAAIPERGRALAARQLTLWTNQPGQEITRMRQRNAEWDFMGRSFFVWSLAEMCLREPASREHWLPVMDRIIEETLRLEQEEGMYYFLMSYARSSPFKLQPARSQFIDGEIALMLAARCLVAKQSNYEQLLRRRVDHMIAGMRQSPVLSVESYPNECWTFCNAVALAAIRLSDQVHGDDHSEFLKQWVATAKEKLVHAPTGLLISSYGVDGQHFDGPEGSSIWMVAHCLQLVDEAFARDQYERARRELGRSFCGFGWSREWPASERGAIDVDSGPIVPVLEASAGGSGLAFIGAASFADHEFLLELHTTLDMAAMPRHENGTLRYCASNQVGDAVMLYATVLGPLWQLGKQHSAYEKNIALAAP